MRNAAILISLPPDGIDPESRLNVTSREIIFPPLGLMSLACSLKKAAPDRDVECLDFNLLDYSGLRSPEDYRGLIRERLERYIGDPPRFFCISVMFSAAHGFFALVASCLRELFPDGTIICGGVHVSGMPGVVLGLVPEVDFAVCGEGEDVLPRLMAAVEAGEAVDMQGVLRRDRAMAAGAATAAPAVEDIDIDFRLYADCFDMERYVSRIDSFNIARTSTQPRAFAIMASRGCPGRCYFCASAVVHGRRPRWRSLGNIRDEILWLNERYGVTKIYLMDDNFVPKQKALDLFGMLAGIGIPGFEVIIQNMSVNHTDFEMIDALAAVNAGYLPFAIESGVPEIQKRMGKNCDLEKAFRLVRYAQGKGMNVRCFYILGFPDETVADMRRTIDYAEALDADWSTFNVAVPLPGTPMYARFVELGYIGDSPEFWGAANIRERVFDTDEQTAEEIKDMAYAANLRLNFLDNRLVRLGRYAEAEGVFRNFLAGVDFHLFGYESLRRIYALTGERDREAATLEKMIAMVRDDPRSRAFEKYFYMLDDETAAVLAAAIGREARRKGGGDGAE